MRTTSSRKKVAAAIVGVPLSAALVFSGGVASAAPALPDLPGALGSLGSLAAPNPVDLYNSAQDALVVGNYADGLAGLGALSVVTPGDANVAALQAFYHTASGDPAGAAGAAVALGHLAVVDPALSGRVTDALAAITASATLPVNYTPLYDGARTAIVALGFGLLPDGAMRPELIDRLKAAAAGAAASPASPVVVTGGNPQKGIAEADAMRDWLTANEVAPERIHVENRANSTVQNATLTVPILQSLGATSTVIATSANHIRRATSDFTIAGAHVIGATWAGTPPNVPASGTLGMTVDATKVIGIPRTY